jgi:hypothetical protein
MVNRLLLPDSGGGVMISTLTAVVVALVAFAVALFKGRTGWHWLLLSLVAFAMLWLLTAVALHFSDIRISIANADRQMALFVGTVTAAVIGIILLAVPSRRRRRRGRTGFPREDAGVLGRRRSG